MLTVLDVLRRTETFFTSRGVPEARLQAELLLAHVLGVKRLDLYLQFERPLPEETLAELRPLVKRRASREPLQYILGETEFAGLTLRCDRRALIPRPETEQLYEIITERVHKPARILDVGTGTGALALALATRFPDAVVVATDISADALTLAGENAARHGLSDRIQFLETNGLTGLVDEGPFDLVVSNPPYLSETELDSAAPEVRDHEPGLALVAEKDGLALLEHLLREAPAVLCPGGTLALETGLAQGERLRSVATEVGWVDVESLADWSGRERFFLARKAD